MGAVLAAHTIAEPPWASENAARSGYHDIPNIKLAMSHVVPVLVPKVLKGQDHLHILGDGSQMRHYTYGGDLARGVCLVARI